MKISDCRKLKVHSPTPPGLSYTGIILYIYQFTNRPGLPQDRPGTNIHPTGLFCSASYVTCTPAYPLVSFRVVTGTPPTWKDSFTTHSYTCEFSIFTVDHVPSPNFNQWCEDLARKKHFASDKNRPGLALDRSGFVHSGLQGPTSFSAYPTGHIFCFFLTSLFEGNK